MTNNDINVLMNKYWEGSSSLEEEMQLRTYFNGSVDAEYLPFQDLFQTFSNQASVKSTTDFDSNNLESLSTSLLLKKYWDCNTSLDEEEQLRQYFAQDKVDIAFVEYQDLFRSLTTQASIKSSASFNIENAASISISKLLEKYWDCTTTIEEEQELKQYFAQAVIDEKFIQYQDLFRVFDQQVELVSNGQAKTIKLNSEKTEDRKPKLFSFSKKWMSVAASLFLGMMIWFNADKLTEMNNPFNDYAVENEDEALEITMEALAFLSGKLDKSSASIKNDFKKVANANLLK